MSSIIVHFPPDDVELGWHFDNFSFAVTLLLQAPTGGGKFHHVPSIRQVDDETAYTKVADVFDGKTAVKALQFEDLR